MLYWVPGLFWKTTKPTNVLFVERVAFPSTSKLTPDNDGYKIGAISKCWLGFLTRGPLDPFDLFKPSEFWFDITKSLVNQTYQTIEELIVDVRMHGFTNPIIERQISWPDGGKLTFTFVVHL